MNNNTNTSTDGEMGSLFVWGAVLCFIAWAFYYYSSIIIKSALIFSVSITVFGSIVTMTTMNNASAKSKKWWTDIAIPYFVTLFSTGMVFVARSNIDKTLVLEAEKTRDYFKFSLQTMTHEQFNFTLYQILGLLLALILLFFCVMALMRQPLIPYSQRYTLAAWYIRWSKPFSNSYFLIVFSIISFLLISGLLIKFLDQGFDS